MSGVGSFEREGKVLYVANVANSPDAEKTVYKHFVEWGPIESGNLTCLFVLLKRTLTHNIRKNSAISDWSRHCFRSV